MGGLTVAVTLYRVSAGPATRSQRVIAAPGQFSVASVFLANLTNNDPAILYRSLPLTSASRSPELLTDPRGRPVLQCTEPWDRTSATCQNRTLEHSCVLATSAYPLRLTCPPADAHLQFCSPAHAHLSACSCSLLRSPACRLRSPVDALLRSLLSSCPLMFTCSSVASYAHLACCPLPAGPLPATSLPTLPDSHYPSHKRYPCYPAQTHPLRYPRHQLPAYATSARTH